MDLFTSSPIPHNSFMASPQYTFTKHYPRLFYSCKTSSIPIHKKTPESSLISRRFLTSISLGATLLVKDLVYSSSSASSVEFRLTAPDQSPEEANAEVKLHARNLLRIKPFIDSKSWKEAQIVVRESSPVLRQDLYTIIQTKPPSERGELRRLYSDLFNNVTTLDYAARDKDENQIKECYDNIVTALDEIFARI